MITELLDEAYEKGNYALYVKLFNDYLKEGKDFGIRAYIQYIGILTRLKKFDEATNLLKRLEDRAKKDHLENTFAKLYTYAFKPIEAERILQHKETFNYSDYYLLSKIYLMQGDLKNAKICAKKCINTCTQDNFAWQKSKEILNKINNNIYRNAYIECEYECFKKNGNVLSPGHIVFLKENVDSINGIEPEIDEKSAIRPYMIWKIDNEKLYMFPVATKRYNEKNHVLFRQDYPNNKGDRIIKNNLCISKESNILSVQDKVLEKDYYEILKCIFRETYFSKNETEKAAKNIFMREFIGEVKEKNILFCVNIRTNESYAYYVNNVYENEYLVFPYNYHEKVIDSNPIIISRDYPILKVINTTQEEIDIIENQIPKEYKNITRKRDFN